MTATVLSGTRRLRPRAAHAWAKLPPKARAGAALLAVFVVGAVIGPLVAPYNPSYQNPSPSAALQAPDWAHLLGTTSTGQDVFSQLLVGVRMTLEVGLAVGVIATALSVIVGVSAGYFGGAWDEVLSLTTNVFLVVPGLPLLVVLLGYLPEKGEAPTIVVLALLGWPWGARVLRSQTLSLRSRDYVAASRECGEPSLRVMLFEIVPNEVSLIASSFVGTVLYAVGTSVALAFLGLSDLSTWSLGTMLYWSQSQSALQSGAWWWFVPPGIAVALIGTALVLLNFGLDELGNPRLRTAVVRRPWRPWLRRSGTLSMTALGPVAQELVASTTGAQRSGSSRALAVPRVGRRASGRPGPNGEQSPFGQVAPGTEPPPPVLEITGLSVSYGTRDGEVKAVRSVDLALSKGEFLGLAGESGSGKSTLAYGACRLLRAPGLVTAGSVVYRGRRAQPDAVDILRQDARQLHQLRWREVAVVFQSAMNALNPVLRVEEQLLDTIDAHLEVSREEKRERAARMLDLVSIPRRWLRSYPHELSGGMRQRVMIAMALALEPEIVVMDEPTTALDVVVQSEILGTVTELRRQLGFSVIFITHDLSLLLEVADRIAIMYGGQLMEVGSSDDIVNRPAHPYTKGLLASFPPLHGPRRSLSGIPGNPPDMRTLRVGCPFVERCDQARPECTNLVPLLRDVASTPRHSHSSACPYSEGTGSPPQAPLGGGARKTREGQCSGSNAVGVSVGSSPSGPPPALDSTVILEAVGLAKDFRQGWGPRRSVLSAVKDVSFRLHRGSVLGLVGESGSGKSTVARLLAGQEAPTSGEILYQGSKVDLRSESAFRSYKRSVQMVFQDPFASLNPVHTVRYHLARALLALGGARRERELDAEVLELLRQVRLVPQGHYLGRYPHELSGGQRQRVSIARALAARPQVLLADEPVSMLDVSIRLGVLDLLDELRRQLDLAILYITHDIASARYFADEVAVMYAGRLVEHGPAEQVTQAPAHPYTQRLVEAAPDPDRLGSRLPSRRPPPGAAPPTVGGTGSGCLYSRSCPRADSRCRQATPQLRRVDSSWSVACWYPTSPTGAEPKENGRTAPQYNTNSRDVSAVPVSKGDGL